MLNFYLSPQLSFIFVLVFTIVLGTITQALFVYLGKQLRQYSTRTQFLWDDYLALALMAIRWWWVAPLFFELVTKYLLPGSVAVKTEQIKPLIVVSSIIQLTLILNRSLKLWRESTLAERLEKDPSTVAALGLLSRIIQFVILSLLVLVGLDNLGVDVKALVAGLGIGGIAIALAAQNVLGDLLASLSIVFDKPFVVGDYIVVGAEKGTIEYIGIKSTRVRSLSGEELIFSNKDLLESRVHNFKRMIKRRLVLRFGVLYNTPANLLRQIPNEVQSLVSQLALVEFDRCHLVNLGESSLDFELVFFVQDAEYKTAADLQQEILILMIEKFNSLGVSFAFPTRTLHVETPSKGADL